MLKIPDFYVLKDKKDDKCGRGRQQVYREQNKVRNKRILLYELFDNSIKVIHL